MELHPILEKSSAPKAGLWYVLSAVGESPSVRVGHTCTHVKGQNSSNGQLYVIGGANPSGSFGETYVLDLDTYSWDVCEATGFKPRYEHAAFTPASKPGKIYVFGGADQGGNHNDIQVFDTAAKTWTSLPVGGTPPSPRTYHTNSFAGDKFYVYSGGQSGVDPVGDRQLHCFDASTDNWSVINVKGDSPKPRHGHVIAAVGQKLYLHGGMAGSAFYDDLHILDLQKLTWRSVKQKKDHPSARTAHGSVVCGNDLYVFGGMGRNGALDDTYKLDTESLKWTRVDLEGPPPACRLDFGMCLLEMGFHGDSSDRAEEVAANARQARDLLEQQLRLGSAGSGRSSACSGHSSSDPQSRLGSAGSVHSPGGESTAAVSTAGSCQDGAISGTGSASPAAAAAATASLSEPACGENCPSENGAVALASHSTALCLVLGGMDTEGEIFDDCLVLALQ